MIKASFTPLLALFVLTACPFDPDDRPDSDTAAMESEGDTTTTTAGDSDSLGMSSTTILDTTTTSSTSTSDGTTGTGTDGSGGSSGGDNFLCGGDEMTCADGKVLGLMCFDNYLNGGDDYGYAEMMECMHEILESLGDGTCEGTQFVNWLFNSNTNQCWSAADDFWKRQCFQDTVNIDATRESWICDQCDCDADAGNAIETFYNFTAEFGGEIGEDLVGRLSAR